MKKIRVVVFKDDSCAYDMPDTPKEFLKWWENKFALTPEEYRDQLKIDCSTSTYYDSAQFEVEIYYYRLETDEEESARLKKEQQAKDFRENQELCELERLRNKYGV